MDAAAVAHLLVSQLHARRLSAQTGRHALMAMRGVLPGFWLLPPCTNRHTDGYRPTVAYIEALTRSARMLVRLVLADVLSAYMHRRVPER